jgi:hypothetical protein
MLDTAITDALLSGPPAGWPACWQPRTSGDDMRHQCDDDLIATLAKEVTLVNQKEDGSAQRQSVCQSAFSPGRLQHDNWLGRPWRKCMATE